MDDAIDACTKGLDLREGKPIDKCHCGRVVTDEHKTICLIYLVKGAVPYPEGTAYYDQEDECIYVYDGTQWLQFTGPGM